MPPRLARHFINTYSKPGDVVLDPFCGKGTVLLEASLLGRRSVGFDVAPDAVIVSKAKLNPPPLKALERALDSLDCGATGPVRVGWRVRTFFSQNTLAQILSIRDQLLGRLNSGSANCRRNATFLLGTLLGILHGHSKLSLSLSCSHSFAMSPNYVREYADRLGLRRPFRNVKECLRARSVQLLADPPPLAHGRVFLCGAEKYRAGDGSDLTDSVDLILTSPPYLNVQTYAKDSWLRLWLLGYDYRRIKGRFIETGSTKLYRERMTPCLSEMLRVLKPLHHAVIIAGDVPLTVDGKRCFFETAEDLAQLATSLSLSGSTFRVEARIKDEIPAHARYYSSVHKDGMTNGNDDARKGVIIERAVVLKKVRVP